MNTYTGLGRTWSSHRSSERIFREFTVEDDVSVVWLWHQVGARKYIICGLQGSHLRPESVYEVSIPMHALMLLQLDMSKTLLTDLSRCHKSPELTSQLTMASRYPCLPRPAKSTASEPQVQPCGLQEILRGEVV